ncbi:MAG: LamB/YcsF family protein [Nocardioides sp.]|nr:LamB/YcsF family protein [Nocardioides sp.]
MPQIALTTDIGEGLGRWELADDDALLDIVTSANIACGFHGGDPGIMRRTCQTSVDNNVSIGAQVSYRDLHGFGRRYIAVPQQELTDDLLYQMGALEAFARLAGGQVDYIRAHGALYNASAKVTEHAQAIVDATRAFNPELPLLCQVGTETWRLGQDAGLRTVAEAFVDRAYTTEGLLVPRTEPNAMYADPEEAGRRAVQMATTGKIEAIDGSSIQIQAEALLVHCDTTGAVEIARSTRSALVEAGIELVPLR